MSDDNASTSKKENNKEGSDEGGGEEDETTMASIGRFFDRLRLISGRDEEKCPNEKVIEDLTFKGLLEHWKNKGFKNIITMVGAGISTSAGIPDFRSPHTGLYDNLERFNLPNPTAIFDLEYFQKNPKPFFSLAKKLCPGEHKPSRAHYFIKLLHEKGLLLRHYTQNIDALERVAGIPEDKIVEAHGTFHTSHCMGCHKLYSMEWMREKLSKNVDIICETCKAVVKPDIVFFGENLPERFYTLPDEDFDKCDLLIIMGTSLEVQPFASLVDRAPRNCLRLLINRNKVGQGRIMPFMFNSSGLQFDSELNTRDIAYIGDCDAGASALAEGLDWKEELDILMNGKPKSLEDLTWIIQRRPKSVSEGD